MPADITPSVVSRIAPHHFADVEAATIEMARVSRNLVLVVDNLYRGEVVEEAERLRDPTHVRSYSEEEWRDVFERAGLAVDSVWGDFDGAPAGPDSPRLILLAHKPVAA